MSKGSSPRPFSIDRKTFENNWDQIFKKEEKPQPPWDHYSDLPSPNAYEESDDSK